MMTAPIVPTACMTMYQPLHRRRGQPWDWACAGPGGVSTSPQFTKKHTAIAPTSVVMSASR